MTQKPNSGQTSMMMAKDAAEMDPVVKRFVQIGAAATLFLIMLSTIPLVAFGVLPAWTFFAALVVGGFLLYAMVRPRSAMKMLPGFTKLAGLFRPMLGRSRVSDAGPPDNTADRRN